MDHSGGADERFDASQYAFFGGDESQELELGGLDEDGGEGLESSRADAGSSTSRDDEGSLKGSEMESSLDGRGVSNTREKLENINEPQAASVPWMDSHRSFTGPDQRVTSSAPSSFAPPSPPEYAGPSLGQAWMGGSRGFASQGPVSYQAVNAPSVRQPIFQQPGRPHAQIPNMMAYARGMQGQPNPMGPGVGRVIFPYQPPPGGGVPGVIPFMVRDLQYQQSPPAWSGHVPVIRKQPLVPPQVVLQHEGLHAAYRPSAPASKDTEQGSGVLAPPAQQTMGPGPSYTGDSQFRPMQPQIPGWHSYQQQERTPIMHREQGEDSFEHNGWQQHRSKYMTAEEIDNIVRIQWAATHSSDPYIDDYYHQAVQAKVDSGATPHGRRHFAPSNLREQPSHTRPPIEPHPFLQIKALGRIPFPSIRRPRPLLEMDPIMSGDDGGIEGGRGVIDQLIADTKKLSLQRPLEQEPMLAVRIVAEDGLCLLLDVDDIDRFLAVMRPPDGGLYLRRRRQILLEGLAVLMNLSNNHEGQYGKDAPFDGFGDNLTFLRLVSLTKGRKLVTKYLGLLLPGTELVTLVTMSIFRNLNFLFGGVQKDINETSVNAGLATAVAVCISSLSLSPLSALLAALVLSPEHPPLRPVGNPAGDGATLVVRAVLERATILLTHHNTAYQPQKLAGWQAAFDAFFLLLTNYCTKKYESIIHTLVMSASSDMASATAGATAAMSKEIPVELLKACLPHTNEHQRRQLLEFTQRSIGMGGHQSSS